MRNMYMYTFYNQPRCGGCAVRHLLSSSVGVVMCGVVRRIPVIKKYMLLQYVLEQQGGMINFVHHAKN